MYQAVEYKGRKTPETENPSPFAKYGWIKKTGECFIRNKLNINDFNIHIFAHILYIFWNNYLKCESFKLEDLLKESSPGRVFLFSLEEVSELLETCSKKNNYFNYSRTGGYLIVQPNKEPLKLALNNYYKDMSV